MEQPAKAKGVAPLPLAVPDAALLEARYELSTEGGLLFFSLLL
jgi:hypothetical protein